MELKTPLYDRHVQAGAKIVPFAGYLMPIQYSGIIKEHMATREQAGLFDVSHMGEITLKGPDALACINYICTNDFTTLKTRGIRYSPICGHDGGILDDLLVYCMGEDSYMLVVNASNRKKDAEWIKQNLKGDVTFEDVSDSIAQLALQGPQAKEILTKLTDASGLPEKYYTFEDNIDVAGVNCLVSQTGYTGEHGYELYCPADKAEKLWDAIMEAGKESGLIECGLGARDTLRLEAGMPLYGHEMTDKINPLEAGLKFAVKMAKEDFIGKAAIEKSGQPEFIRVGIELTGRGIAREECDIYSGDNKIGVVTSGTHCPFVGKSCAMGRVEAAYSDLDTVFDVEVRGKRIAAKVVKLPFIKK